MKGIKIFRSMNNFFQRIYDIALLNICFIIFTLRGFVLLGIFPALVSLLHNTRLIFFENKDISIWKSFKERFKSEFKQSNIIGWILIIVGSGLYLNYKIIQQTKYDIPYFIIFSFYTVIFVYVIVILWVFPLLSIHYNTIKKYLFNALVLGVTNIFNTILLIFIAFLLAYVSLSFPAVLLFFTGSIFSIISLLVTKNNISKIEITKDN